MGTGKKTNRKGREWKFGQTGLLIKGLILMGRSKEKGCYCSQMVQYTKGNSKTMTSKDMESIDGQMDGCMKVSGTRTRCMDSGKSREAMAGFTKGTTRTTRNTGRALSIGQMGGRTRGSGTRANNMELAHTLLPMGPKRSENGSMERGLSGSITTKKTDFFYMIYVTLCLSA